MPKVLFICRQRQTEYGISYGLLNSCRFLCNALEELGIEAKVVPVVDNNCIDREVSKYRPTHVFIEAFWVVPEKFNVLIPLHPNVKWYVRLHSNTPFLATEGVAMNWIDGYEHIRKHGGKLWVAPNSTKLVSDLQLVRDMPVVYAPNIYCPKDGDPFRYTKVPVEHNHHSINIGCFGAIRPMKNHLEQAIAAIGFADKIGKHLHFHINGRCEQFGEPIFNNLHNLFKGTRHTLFHHPWCDHPEFMALVREMDLGMQVSFSETFNIVAADFVSSNIPLVGSNEIEWLSRWYRTNPTNTEDMIAALSVAYHGRKIHLQELNKLGLMFSNYRATMAWIRLLSK